MLATFNNPTLYPVIVPWPLKKTLAPGATVVVPLDFEDLVQAATIIHDYRFASMKEILDLRRAGKLNVGLAMEPENGSRSLVEMALLLAGGSLSQKGLLLVPGAPASIAVVFPVAAQMPNTNYVVSVELDGADGWFVSAKGVGGFTVNFVSGAYPGTQINWKAEYHG